MAKQRPMQARWPLPKGFQALTGRLASVAAEYSRIEGVGLGPRRWGRDAAPSPNRGEGAFPDLYLPPHKVTSFSGEML